MDESSLRTTLARLAKERPVFHSEADFQHAFAWGLRSAGLAVRLERPLRVGDERMVVDVVGQTGREWIGVELKHWTRHLELERDGEDFSSTYQSAQDLGRYDFWRDVARLERLTSDGKLQCGFVVALTNDPSYWKPGRSHTNDEDFRLHEGRTVQGTLMWGRAAVAGTIRSREVPITLRGRYTAEWTGYSCIPDRPFGTFRYLLASIVP